MSGWSWENLLKAESHAPIIKKAKIEAVNEFLCKLKMHARKMTGADFGGEFWDVAVLKKDAESIAKEMGAKEDGNIKQESIGSGKDDC